MDIDTSPSILMEPDATVTHPQIDESENKPILEEVTSIKNEMENSVKEEAEPLPKRDLTKSTSDSDADSTIDQERTLSRNNKAATKIISKPTTAEDNETIDNNMDFELTENYLQKLAYAYATLFYVFQYLDVQDLLRVRCVCTVWREVANHPALWRTVRIKNSQIHSFEGLADALEKHGTVNLDLRKMLLPNRRDHLWPSFSSAINKVDSLRKIDLCKCPAAVVEQLPRSNPKLEVINAVTINPSKFSLNPFVNVVHLQELRLKASEEILILISDLSPLKELKHLKHLSLTSIIHLSKPNVDVIGDLKNLISLDIGHCVHFPDNFGSDILTKLEKLEKLRLESIDEYAIEILESIKNMPKLQQLELVNCIIECGFEEVLGACFNIRKLLIIPIYSLACMFANRRILCSIQRLQSTLSHFVWGITLDELQETDAIVRDLLEDSEMETIGDDDYIVVSKPVPFLDEPNGQVPQIRDIPEIEIVPLPSFQILLQQKLPEVQVKILNIPFDNTWRQRITDTWY